MLDDSDKIVQATALNFMKDLCDDGMMFVTCSAISHFRLPIFQTAFEPNSSQVTESGNFSRNLMIPGIPSQTYMCGRPLLIAPRHSVSMV